MQAHAVNGALAIGITQLIKLPFQIGSLLVLPRLLQPMDYGIYAMIDPLIAISALILNFGIGQAVIQAPALQRPQVAGLFWITGSYGINYQFEQRPLSLLLINGGYHTAQYTLYGLILGLWH